MAGLVRPINVKKPVVNRWLIGVAFGLTGIVSVIFWWRGTEKDRLPNLEGWWQPLRISYSVQPRHVARSEADISRPTARFISQLRRKLEEESGDYGVYVYRLGEKVGYGLAEDQVLPAASIMKVPIMVAVYRAAAQGQINLDETYVLQEGDKQSGSGPIEFMAAGTKLTIRRLLEEMGKKSDNTAPMILIRLVGRSAIKDTLQTLGMTRTDFDKNTTTAYDVAKMWHSLYLGKVVTGDYREQLWGMLRDTIYEDRIPAGLSKGEVVVVHKVGTDVGVWADAGIVMPAKPEQNFDPLVIVILNQGVNIEEAKEAVPQITTMIWDFELSRAATPR